MNDLSTYVTNANQPIFALRNLPEVVKGALFSRYSRSEKGLKELLAEEFLNDESRGTESAEQFYDRVLGGYGDDSIAEQGGAHVACEEISNIAAKALEDCRIGISFLEKSTRYVVFNRRPDGTYPYYRDSSIMLSKHKTLYERTLNYLFDEYHRLLEHITPFVIQWYPQDLTTSERAYKSTIKAKKLDLLRGLLPLATLTNVGMNGNGLAFRHLLTKLYASEFEENRDLALSLQSELEKVIPSFVKQVTSENGMQSIHYLKQKRQNTKEMAAWLTKKYQSKRTDDMKALIEKSRVSQQTILSVQPEVNFINYDPQAEQKIASAIIFSESEVDTEESMQIAWKMSRSEMISLFRTYAGDRKNRRHRPGRAFEEIYYTFEICADIGAYRDLQRHRMLTQERQDFTVAHGFAIPPELKNAGLDLQYRIAMDRASECYEQIFDDFPVEAQYVVPFGYRVRWKMKFNLREAFHLLELRSQRQGHPSYRAIVLSMFDQIKKVHPCFTDLMTWMDFNNYDLARLLSEQKQDLKERNQ